MQSVYSLILYLAVPLVLCRLLWSGLSDRDYLKRWPERFGHVRLRNGKRPVIWIHAVSVGEVQASRPLVDYLQKHCPANSLLITTTTPGGARTAGRIYGHTVEHSYFPYDLPHVMNRFLDTVRPALLIIMETEIWPNLYHRCRRRAIPVALINARLSEKSFRGYRRLGDLAVGTLRCLSLVASQSEADAARFRSLGADPGAVRVTGNLKFDINQPYSISEAAEVKRRFFGVGRPVWIAASTHEGEEDMILEAFSQVLEQLPRCLLILAPRHPERAAEIMELCNRSGFQTVRHTENRDYTEHTRVYILDTLGELPVFYAASDISFVGGSLVRVGGHNMLEPASLGIPVITGNHVFNFIEVSELLHSAGALVQVSTVDELASKVCLILEDANLSHAMGQQGRQVVSDNQGTTARLIESLREFFPINQS